MLNLYYNWNDQIIEKIKLTILANFATFAESLHCKGVWDTVHGHIVDLDHSVIFTEQTHETLLENTSENHFKFFQPFRNVKSTSISLKSRLQIKQILITALADNKHNAIQIKFNNKNNCQFLITTFLHL